MQFTQSKPERFSKTLRRVRTRVLFFCVSVRNKKVTILLKIVPLKYQFSALNVQNFPNIHRRVGTSIYNIDINAVFRSLNIVPGFIIIP